jgi:hypothetical protein
VPGDLKDGRIVIVGASLAGLRAPPPKSGQP